MKYHIHAYEVIDKIEIDVIANSEKEAKNFAAKMIQERNSALRHYTPESKYILLAFILSGKNHRPPPDEDLTDF